MACHGLLENILNFRQQQILVGKEQTLDGKSSYSFAEQIADLFLHITKNFSNATKIKSFIMKIVNNWVFKRQFILLKIKLMFTQYFMDSENSNPTLC